MVLRPVDRDVLVDVLRERGHQLLEVGLPAHLAHMLGGEVRVHPGAVPIERRVEGPADRLAAPFDVDAVLLAEAGHNVAGDPHLVGGALGALAEDLELPLALSDLGIDALDVDSGVEADVDVLLDDLAGHRADVLVADAGVVRALGLGEAARGEAKGRAVLEEEVLLLEAEPGARIIRDGGAGVRGVGDAGVEVGLAHHEHAVLAGGVREDRDGLQHDIGALALGLAGRAAVEAPVGKFGQLREALEFLDLGLAAEVGQRGVAVEPDVFQFVLGHMG